MKSPGPRHVWLRGFLTALVALCALTLVLETFSLNVDGDASRLRSAVRLGVSLQRQEGQEPVAIATARPVATAPDEEGGEVPAADRLHLSLLHEACVTNVDAVVSWQFGAPQGGHQLANATADNAHELLNRNDSNLLDKLRRCPDVDIFLPIGLRGNGYCEDAAAYAKFETAADVGSGDQVLRRRAWTRRGLLRLVSEDADDLLQPLLGRRAAVSTLAEGQAAVFDAQHRDDRVDPSHYWGVYAVLCKTHVCYDRVTRWYAENGNPRNAKVFYTKHTSSDQAEFARRRLGEESIAPKDFSDVKFIHTAGTSVWKGTRGLVDCWVMSAGLPQLNVYIDDSAFNYLFPPSYKRKLERARSPVHIEHGMLEPQDFCQLTAESAFFMCPSRSEGFGHYINQARASGGVVITTDAHPMNELIVSNEMGVLVPARYQHDTKMLLGGRFRGEHGLKDSDGLLVRYSSHGLCTAVRDFISSTTPEERAAMGARARQQYHEDTKYFARSMRKLREFASS
ncbi:hypothetical protein PF004_g18188 [Phytophthora fragariae]|uniref:Uncharacterized protein n=1 Tax=Phytophthora fragariae TaxID=53985 RepID=A0A6G0NDA7_9STRA|nr:hypothetical protein PF004_g18188 [Phytophthora fragariae]